MTTITVSKAARDQLMVVKENLGYERMEDLLTDLAKFAEDNMDEFDAAFPAEDKDTEDEDEEK